MRRGGGAGRKGNALAVGVFGRLLRNRSKSEVPLDEN